MPLGSHGIRTESMENNVAEPLGSGELLRSSDDFISSPGLLHPGKDHLKVLVGVWENSVSLNVAPAILRQTLMDLMAYRSVPAASTHSHPWVSTSPQSNKLCPPKLLG